MTSYIEQLEQIKPLLENNSFCETINRFKHYWKYLKEYQVYENLAVVGTESVMVIVPSYNNNKFTKLFLTREGETACVSYLPEHGGVTLKIFVDKNNKIKAIHGYDNDSNRPSLDLFYAENIVRFFHSVMPKDEIPEILFQASTVIDIDLSLIEELL